MSVNYTGPHAFEPQRRWFNRGRCRHCILHERLHPAQGWVEARPFRDRSLPVGSKVRS